MSIAIVVITHGQAAQELLYSAEMIVGKRENVGAIHFLTIDNGEILTTKIKETLQTMDTQAGVLFLVDLWGGTPFNSAGRLLAEQEKYQVVSGVNVPMLVQILLERDKCNDVAVLAREAREAGSAGIEILTLGTLPPPAEHDEIFDNSNDEPMDIALVRIDDRLVHGKVMTSWLQQVKAERIVIVNDAAANDPTRILLFRQSAPHGVKADVVSVATMIDHLQKNSYSGERVMLLFTNPTDVLTLVNAGLDATQINLGSMATHGNAQSISPAVAITPEDREALQKLQEKQIKIDLRTVPTQAEYILPPQ